VAGEVIIALSSELVLDPVLEICIPSTVWKYQCKQAEMFFWLFSNVSVIGCDAHPYRQKANW